MNHLIATALLFLCTYCYADVATEPWPKKLQDLPNSGTLAIKNFKIGVRQSPNQEGAGSGGGMYDFTIQNTRTGAKITFASQSVGIAVLESYRGWPQLEIWGRAGGGSWCRSLHRFTGHNYEYVRTDEFTEFDFHAKDKTRTTTMPHETDLLYFVETRIPE